MRLGYVLLGITGAANLACGLLQLAVCYHWFGLR